MKVGFVGLGNMGASMAERVLGAGSELLVYDISAEARAHFAELGAKVVEGPAELGGCDLVEVCVVNDQQVEEVLVSDGLLEAMAPGAMVAVHSTVHPDTSGRLGELAERRGVGFLDAPVSGGARGAQAGRLVVFVGGDRTVFDRCRPVFESFGVPIFLGPVGSGQLVKLLNNAFFMVQIGVSFELARLAREMNIDLDGLGRALPGSTAATWVNSHYAASGFTHLAPVLATGPEHLVRLMEKDIALFDGVIHEKGLDAGLVPSIAAYGLELLHRGGPLIYDPAVDLAEYTRRIAVLDSPPATTRD
jgi:3-hydroxyisobutyrate dehydrogenase-like beta-hydroxyacid dehydrogenase